MYIELFFFIRKYPSGFLTVGCLSTTVQLNDILAWPRSVAYHGIARDSILVLMCVFFVPEAIRTMLEDVIAPHVWLSEADTILPRNKLVC